MLARGEDVNKRIVMPIVLNGKWSLAVALHSMLVALSNFPPPHPYLNARCPTLCLHIYSECTFTTNYQARHAFILFDDAQLSCGGLHKNGRARESLQCPSETRWLSMCKDDVSLGGVYCSAVYGLVDIRLKDFVK